MSNCFVTPWTVAHQASLSMGFPRQENWSWSPFPSPGDLSDPGIKSRPPTLWGDSLPSEPLGKPLHVMHQVSGSLMWWYRDESQSCPPWAHGLGCRGQERSARTPQAQHSLDSYNADHWRCNSWFLATQRWLLFIFKYSLTPSTIYLCIYFNMWKNI